MLIDDTGRHITYLRISVTDRCNFRCQYCMPEEGIVQKPMEEILSFEQITSIAREAASLGIRKVRLTGGEPLARRGVEKLVGMIAAIPGIDELTMTTNGALLTPQKALELKKAGLQRINISLDTLDRHRFVEMTRRDALDEVLAGIDAAIAAGLTPIKLNMVVFEHTKAGEIEAMRSFCQSKGIRLQTIARYELEKSRESHYASTDRPPRCSECNRLRLTADGYLLPCLFSEKSFRVDHGNIREGILEAVRNKPVRGAFNRSRGNSEIGG